MDSKHKYTGKAMSMQAGLAVGAAVSLGITLIGSFIIAKLLDLEKIQWENVGYGVLILLLVSSFAGALTACGKIKRRKLMVCVISGAIYWAALIAITALFFGGQYEAVWVTGILIMAGSICAALTDAEKRSGQRRKKQRIYR